MAEKTFKQVKCIIEKEFPKLGEPIEVALSIIAAGLLQDLPHCIGLIYQDQPSSSKTTVLDILGNEDPIRNEPNFTPASFVSQFAGKTTKDLEKIDLLPRIQHKVLVTKEMAGFFGQRIEDLVRNISVLTETFDGRGYQCTTGVHGQRGYNGDYRFCMLGATTPLEYKVWQILGKLGSRWVFYHMPEEVITSDILAKEMMGGYREKISRCRAEVTPFIQYLWSKHGGFGGFNWDLSKDNKKFVKMIGTIAIKICAWRGLQLKQEDVGYNPALEEVPRRLAQTLYAIARGHAILNGRKILENEDVVLISKIAYASMPEDRRRIFKFLWEQEEYPEGAEPLTISKVAGLLGCTYPTAEKVICNLISLGLLEKNAQFVTFPIPKIEDVDIFNFLP